MRFEVTYTRTMTLTQVIKADSEAEANALAKDEIPYLLDMDFEEVSITYKVEPMTKEE